MPYTFGTILWSMFHGGAIPCKLYIFLLPRSTYCLLLSDETEPPENIRDRLFRLKNLPVADEEFMPRDVIEVSIYLVSLIKIYNKNFYRYVSDAGKLSHNLALVSRKSNNYFVKFKTLFTFKCTF